VPELPEIRAHAERLTASHGGQELTALRVLSFTALKTAVPPADDAVGQSLDRVDQRGKYLLLRFPPLTYVIHLMQGGRLRPDPKESAKPRGGLLRLRFDPGPALLFTEAGTEHKAGLWVVDGDVEGQSPVDRIGPDADRVDLAQLTELVRGRSMRLHTLLRDQTVLAGIGRRLANEICFHAQLSPFAGTKKLGDDELARLHGAIARSVEEGLAFERGLDEMSSSKQRPGAVHGRLGEPCVVCDTTLRAVEYRDYTVTYCPTCQTGGKILADNTTSKFLK
jgi:formamidopyrimidine-DNA glycosylase